MERRHSRLGAALLSTLLAVTAFGCAPSYGTVEIEPLSTPPVSVTVRDFLIELPAGVAVVVSVSPRSDNHNEYDETYVVDLISQDRDVFTVFRRDDRREFVLVGIAEGDTCVEVRIDGAPQDCIEVTVGPPSGG